MTTNQRDELFGSHPGRILARELGRNRYVRR